MWFQISIDKAESKSRNCAVSSSNLQINEATQARTIKLSHIIVQFHLACMFLVMKLLYVKEFSLYSATVCRSISTAVMPQRCNTVLACRRCSPRPPPELMHAGSVRLPSRRKRERDRVDYICCSQIHRCLQAADDSGFGCGPLSSSQVMTHPTPQHADTCKLYQRRSLSLRHG